MGSTPGSTTTSAATAAASVIAGLESASGSSGTERVRRQGPQRSLDPRRAVCAGDGTVTAGRGFEDALELISLCSIEADSLAGAQ